jgi:hypothetical protein
MSKKMGIKANNALSQDYSPLYNYSAGFANQAMNETLIELIFSRILYHKQTKPSSIKDNSISMRQLEKH